MTVVVTVPDGYGYVLLLAVGAIPFMSTVHGAIVTELRKPAKVPYPNCYASKQEMKENPAAYQFNCAQRAHANFLENAPFAALSMLIAGLTYPKATLLLGCGWVISRALYTVGYVYSGQEKGAGRRLGFPFWLFQGGLWGMACATALKMQSFI